MADPALVEKMATAIRASRGRPFDGPLQAKKDAAAVLAAIDAAGFIVIPKAAEVPPDQEGRHLRVVRSLQAPSRWVYEDPVRGDGAPFTVYAVPAGDAPVAPPSLDKPPNEQYRADEAPTWINKANPAVAPPEAEFVPANWTEVQVANLNRRQEQSYLHPYTCPEGRVLRANAESLFCSVCGYRQAWAHQADLDGEFASPWEATR